MISLFPPISRRKAALQRKNVLVLSGGGINGAMQAGMLASLEETGWVPDHIVGVSAGALNGVWAASNWSAEGFQELGVHWAGMVDRPIFHNKVLSQIAHLLYSRVSLQSANELIRVVGELCPVLDLGDTDIHVSVGATELDTGNLAWFTDGPAHERLVASAAVPGVVAPVSINGVRYVDGGSLSNVPVCRGAELGDDVVVLDVSGGLVGAAPGNTALGVVTRSYRQCKRALEQAQVERVDAQPDIRLKRFQCELPAGLKATHWERTPELVQAGKSQMDILLSQYGSS
jgi:NTE family protein